MNFQAELLSESKLLQLFDIEEDHFNDFKAKDISGKKFSKVTESRLKVQASFPGMLQWIIY